MIGQMQGKFQMVVIPGVGHMLHEVRATVLWIRLPYQLLTWDRRMTLRVSRRFWWSFGDGMKE